LRKKISRKVSEVKANKEVSLEVKSGDIVGLIGSGGSRKSIDKAEVKRNFKI
tara:strand:+ start:90 stop:245 length:156 start_codon:yes stop_codon:yes gene_type:complete